MAFQFGLLSEMHHLKTSLAVAGLQTEPPPGTVWNPVRSPEAVRSPENGYAALSVLP